MNSIIELKKKELQNVYGGKIIYILIDGKWKQVLVGSNETPKITEGSIT